MGGVAPHKIRKFWYGRGSSSHHKNDVKKDVPGHGNENMNMSMDKPMALNRTKGTRGPQVEKSKNELKNKLPWASPAYDLKNAIFQNFPFLRAHGYSKHQKVPLQSMSD